MSIIFKVSEGIDRFLKIIHQAPSSVGAHGFINALEQLDETAQQMEGYFTTAEAAFLCTVFGHGHFELSRFDEWPLLILWDVEDVEKYEKLSSRYDLSPELLLEKLERIEPHQALWLLEQVHRFRPRHGSAGDEAYHVTFDPPST